MSRPVSAQRSAELARHLWDILKTHENLTNETATKSLRCTPEELDAAIVVLLEAMDYAADKVAQYSPEPHQTSREMRDLFAFA